MRSLTLKLALAFLATSVLGTALAAFLIRASVAQSFDDYVLEQQRSAFVAQAAAYYEANGGWQGVERVLGSPGPRGGRSKPAPRSHGEAPGAGFTPFALVDRNGRVVMPAQGYPPGAAVSQADLARGTLVLVGDEPVGTALTVEPEPFRDLAEERYLASTDGALAIAGVVSVGIALALGVALARLITRPAREVTAAAARIAAGDLAQRVPVRSRDELGVLAAQFNRMSADLERATALRRQMTADIAHDLRTPLTVVAGYLEALRDRVLPPTPERFATMHAETQLLLRLVEDLHTLSLADAGELPLQRRAVAPAHLLERVAAAYGHAAERQGVVLAVTASPAAANLSGDSEQLARALGNLVSNALRHTPRGGRVTLGACPAVSGVELSVSDTGTGIAPDHLPNIFERFYRADAARTAEAGGSGLGLAIVKSLVEAHGGRVAVASVPGQGTTFTLTLPAT